MTGADIRRFDEFTDATTRAVVGMHQDLSELREQLARTQVVADDIQESQKCLNERLDRLEQSAGRHANLTLWVPVGASTVALLLSIAALVVGMA